MDTEWSARGAGATCAALGPPSTMDGFPLMCTLEPGHAGRHRNQRAGRDVKWVHPYEPIHDAGELVSSYRALGVPGPDPTQDRLRQAGLELRRTSTPTRPAPATREPYGGYSAPRSWGALEYPVCHAVHDTDLDISTCRRAWYKHHRGQPLAHVCVQRGCRGSETCRCACGKRRDSWRFPPLPATDRPEAPLDEQTATTAGGHA